MFFKSKNQDSTEKQMTPEEFQAYCKERHISVGKTADFPPIIWNEESIPEARVRDRYRHNHNLDIARSWRDYEKHEFVFEYLCNVDQLSLIHVSDEDMCKEFGWKSFIITDDHEVLKPTW